MMDRYIDTNRLKETLQTQRQQDGRATPRLWSVTITPYHRDNGIDPVTGRACLIPFPTTRMKHKTIEEILLYFNEIANSCELADAAGTFEDSERPDGLEPY